MARRAGFLVFPLIVFGLILLFSARAGARRWGGTGAVGSGRRRRARAAGVAPPGPRRATTVDRNPGAAAPDPPTGDDLPMTHVLVVDDEPASSRSCATTWSTPGSACRRPDRARRPCASLRSIVPDLVVLDLGLPGVDGLDVARTVRQASSVPIIMLTARTDEADRVVGLELGADDYLVKPFSPRELLARVRAVLRAGAPAVDDDRPLARRRPASSTRPARRSTVDGRAGRADRDRVRPAGPPGRARPAGCSPGASCWRRSTASPSTPAGGRSTPT